MTSNYWKSVKVRLSRANQASKSDSNTSAGQANVVLHSPGRQWVAEGELQHASLSQSRTVAGTSQHKRPEQRCALPFAAWQVSVPAEHGGLVRYASAGWALSSLMSYCARDGW